MDQAASVFSIRGFLLYTRFFPQFRAEHVQFPKSDPEITFLAAQSFVAADKHVTAPKHYNLRVVECTLAAVVLAKMHNIKLDRDNSSLGFSLRNFQEELMRKEGRLDDALEYQVDAMIGVASDKLDKENSYSCEDISKILEISVPDLEKEYMSQFPVQAFKFQLRARALHVFKEARRVLDFKACLSRAHAHGLDESKLQYLGKLMNDTQTSCRDVYDCSCPELDEICDIGRRAGTYGSRLTGAGWGGCTVHLLPQSKVEAVTDALKKEYYYKKFPDISDEKLKEAIVISKPSMGSFLYVVGFSHQILDKKRLTRPQDFLCCSGCCMSDYSLFHVDPRHLDFGSKIVALFAGTPCSWSQQYLLEVHRTRPVSDHTIGRLVLRTALR